MNRNEAEHLAAAINAWSFPYVRAGVSTLGGEDRSSVMVTVSLDPRESWPSGILENSRHAQLAFHTARVPGHPDAVEFRHRGGLIPQIRGWTAKDKPALYKKLGTVINALRKVKVQAIPTQPCKLDSSCPWLRSRRAYFAR